MLAWVLMLPVNGLQQRRINLELAARRINKIVKDVLEQDDLDWPVSKEEEKERKGILDQGRR